MYREDSYLASLMLGAYVYQMQSKDLGVLQIEPTDICNLRCSMCAPHHEGWEQIHAVPKGIMDMGLYEQIIDGFMDFFEQQSGQSLARDITFLISGDSNAPYIGFLGSALNNQVMLNISGKEAVIHPEKFKRPIYLTLAHEIFHLWNAHLWSPKENTPIWLYEGSADFFAYHAMLQQGLMPQSHFDYFLQQQQKACLEGVKQAAITYLESTSAIGASYPCGRVFFEELTKALNKSHFEIWQDLMAVNRAVQYSVEDVHSLIKQSKVPSDIKQQLEHVLFDNKKAHNALEKLLLAPAIE